MNVQHISAFCDGDEGGNPAGVVILDTLPAAESMQAVAAEVGYSETVFAAPAVNGWRVRYFAPESEVPFCGHATIALGAALAAQFGARVYKLELNHTRITVEGRDDGEEMFAALQSPATRSERATPHVAEEALALFALSKADLDDRIPVAIAFAGARHVVIALKQRQRLSEMAYDLEAGRVFMQRLNLTTISLVHAETDSRFHARNPFASGGVYEDPATGAAAAALAGYLRDLAWPHGGSIEIVQGEDMGMRSVLHAKIPLEAGSSIRVSGRARRIV